MSGADFFNIDEILAINEPISCEFLVEGFNLLSLDQSMICLTSFWDATKKPRALPRIEEKRNERLLSSSLFRKEPKEKERTKEKSPLSSKFLKVSKMETFQVKESQNNEKEASGFRKEEPEADQEGDPVETDSEEESDDEIEKEMSNHEDSLMEEEFKTEKPLKETEKMVKVNPKHLDTCNTPRKLIKLDEETSELNVKFTMEKEKNCKMDIVEEVKGPANQFKRETNFKLEHKKGNGTVCNSNIKKDAAKIEENLKGIPQKAEKIIKVDLLGDSNLIQPPKDQRENNPEVFLLDPFCLMPSKGSRDPFSRKKEPKVEKIKEKTRDQAQVKQESQEKKATEATQVKGNPVEKDGKPFVQDITGTDTNHFSENSNNSNSLSSSNGPTGFTNRIENVKPGCKLNLPLWLALNLFRLKYIKPGTRRLLSDSLLSSLAADPSVVNLRDFNTYFYEHGSKVAYIFNEKSHGTLRILSRTLMERFKLLFLIVIHGTDVKGEHDSQDVFKSKMTSFEKQLYEYSRYHLGQMKKWWGNDYAIPNPGKPKRLLKKVHTS